MSAFPRMPMAPPQHVEIEFECRGVTMTTTVHRMRNHMRPHGSTPAWLNLWHADQCRQPNGERAALHVDIGAGESVARVTTVTFSGTPTTMNAEPTAHALTAVRPLRGR